MIKETLYAQTQKLEPRIDLKSLKNGLIKYINPDSMQTHNHLYLSDVGLCAWKALSQLDSNATIRFQKHTRSVGLPVNWQIELIGGKLKIILIMVQYYQVLSMDTSKAQIIQLKLEGNQSRISEYVKKFIIISKKSPYNVTKWDKFEKKFGVTKEECITSWKKYEQ